MAYAGAEFWDPFFRQRLESGNDLDWGGLWTGPFLIPLHFFSEAYLRELLGEWQELHLASVPIPHRETGEPYKHVWRGIARR